MQIQKNKKIMSCIYYIFVCMMFISLFFVLFNSNTLKASAKNSDKQMYNRNISSINAVKETINPTDIAINIRSSIDKTTESIIENYVPESPLSDSDIELLARVIHAESGNQDEDGKRLVADVVLNRMAYCDSSMYDVVYSYNQFSTASILYNSTNTPTDEEIEIARQESISQFDYSVYYFRTNHYHEYGTPAFVHGDHYFSTL